jgi:hypothetical protein
MKLEIYAIKDLALGEFASIGLEKNDTLATRRFAKQLEQSETPEDYELWYVGKMDMENGKIDSALVPIFISDVGVVNAAKQQLELIKESDK